MPLLAVLAAPLLLLLRLATFSHGWEAPNLEVSPRRGSRDGCRRGSVRLRPNPAAPVGSVDPFRRTLRHCCRLSCAAAAAAAAAAAPATLTAERRDEICRPSIAETFRDEAPGSHQQQPRRAPSRFAYDELWLDLSGTALAPTDAAVRDLEAALRRLRRGAAEGGGGVPGDEAEDPTTPAPFFDRVLVSAEACPAAQASSAPLDVVGLTGAGELVPVHPRGGSDARPPAPIGWALGARPDGHLDPVAALGAVARGGWILVDATDRVAAPPLPAIDRIGALFEFLSAALSPSPGGRPAAAPLSAGSDSDFCGAGALPPSEEGGVAVRCAAAPRLAELFGLRAAHLLSRGAAATGSGIAVPRPQRGGGAGSSRSDRESVASQPNLRAALLLPLDLALWETAIDLNRSLPLGG
jgi:hypothetical protein